MSETIRVCCRFRPLPSHASPTTTPHVTHPTDSTVQIAPPLFDDPNQMSTGSILSDTYRFNFDQIFNPLDSTADVYKYLGPSVSRSVLEGFNSCLFVYGQTGAGKTHTMMGRDALAVPDTDLSDSTEPDGDRYGLTPLIIQDIFKGFAEAPDSVTFTIRVSYVEVYLERVKDLLSPAFHGRDAPMPSKVTGSAADQATPENLPLRNGPALPGGGSGGVFIAGCSEYYCSCESDVLYHLNRGSGVRAVGETKMNRDSSRSHSVFIVKVERREDGSSTNATSEETGVMTGQLYLVDLAGSESVGKTGADGIRLKEAQIINKSLSSLGNVINALR